MEKSKNVDHDIDQEKKSGVYILKNSMTRGGGGCREKNEAVRNKMKKKGKGERKKKKRKRGRFIFLLIYGTLLLIIVY